jgi:5'(3')-deoxyribonucleotidase
MWEVPESFMDKRIWIERYFGKLATNRLILTQRKGLNIGEYLVDDRTWNGAGELGKTFGTEKFPTWLELKIF